jgi:PIN domain
MKTLAEAVAEMAPLNRPVLCLDTCVFLDVITTGNRGEADLIGVNRTLLNVLVTTPERLHLVVTELIVHEWGQRREGVEKEARTWLKETDRHIQQIHRAWEELKKPLAHGAPKYNDPGLTDELTALSRSLLDQAVVLQEDGVCVTRALDRVKQKKWPSHEGQIKDSVHIEHFLEFSTQLAAAGHGADRILVSTNKSDFWEDKNTPTRPHEKLVEDFSKARLLFLGRLPLALRQLGILS